jgi:hypothetical protein
LHLTPTQGQQARELLTSCKADLGLPQDVAEFLGATAKELVRPCHWSEMESLSTALDLPVADVVLCKLLLRRAQGRLGLHRVRRLTLAMRFFTTQQVENILMLKCIGDEYSPRHARRLG